jgi:DNA-binding CsgD family transcriptional regulator
MVDPHLTPSPSSPQPSNALRIDERLRLLEREQGDELARRISRRMVAAERPRPPIIEAPIVNAAGRELLTPRMEECVALVGDGMSNAEIAKAMNLSEHTVKTYIHRIFDRLGVSSRVELALYAAHNRRAEPPAAPNAGLMERAASLLNELLLDDRIAPSQIIAAKSLHEQIMAACNIKKPVASVAENGTLRAQGHGHRERRHTKTFLQPLGLPVWIKGEKCLAVVRENFVLSNPRDHEVVDYWFPSVEKARERFPDARLLTLPEYKRPEVPVQVQLQVCRAAACAACRAEAARAATGRTRMTIVEPPNPFLQPPHGHHAARVFGGRARAVSAVPAALLHLRRETASPALSRVRRRRGRTACGLDALGDQATGRERREHRLTLAALRTATPTFRGRRSFCC